MYLDHTEPLNVNGNIVDVPAANLIFNRWTGEPIKNSFKCKPILEYEAKPMFAELAITHFATKGGWSSRWAEVYHLKNNEPFYPTEWLDVPGFNQTSRPLESPYYQKLMATIESKNCLTVNKKAEEKRKP